MPGDALGRGSGSSSALTLPPGQEVIVLVRAMANASDDPLEITKLRAVPGEGVPESVQVVQVSAVAPSSQVPPGTYVTFPPVTRARGKCLRARMRAASGVAVESRDEPMLAIWLRSIAEGGATIDGVRALYEQSGTLYEQELLAQDLIDISVEPDAPALKPSRDEQACAHEVRILPGAVTY
jgi:hypothetical protein